jgi:putative DNA methylase
MTGSRKVVPFSLKDAPALIEHIFPAQKLSVESYKEQMAGSGKTLTSLGSYWKGRKPLILNRACVLGALLPATGDLKKDLSIFEKLMGMDDESFVVRLGRIRPASIVERIVLQEIDRYFVVDPPGSLPKHAPFYLEEQKTPDGKIPKIRWREGIPEAERRMIESRALPPGNYYDLVSRNDCLRTESCGSEIHNHIWVDVNGHLGTNAHSMPELVDQLGIMRYGHRPRVADTFCGSGQIPFEAARLGCDVYASDLNPIACMLTWGAFNIVGAPSEKRAELEIAQRELAQKTVAEIDKLGVESDENGWRVKVFLYCIETVCPQTGWTVPLLPSRLISTKHKVVAELVPDSGKKRYNIVIRTGANSQEVQDAVKGTVRSDGRGQDPYLIHVLDGKEYRTKISTLRGDYRKEDGTNGNRLRMWDLQDFKPREGDIFQERLYAIQWMRQRDNSKRYDYEFRSVTSEDLRREKMVEDYVASHLPEWQERGYAPDMRIEPGYNTDQPIRERGWTHWHHMFFPRQILTTALAIQQLSQISSGYLRSAMTCMLSRTIDYNSKLTTWAPTHDTVNNTFSNQALNTILNPPCRASIYYLNPFLSSVNSFPINSEKTITSVEAMSSTDKSDIFITDPPYGDAVKYEEILEFFIAWLRKNPPPEFADWTWDSRRSLAIKGEDEDFRREMVSAYKRMTELMPDNGIQIIMFTHQSGSIWSDMANIVWASGLQVTAAWYVVTETNSALRGAGSHYVKGTVLLVLRKRLGEKRSSRDDLAMDIQEEVEDQVRILTGLNQEAKDRNRDENLFSDADLQMAGYAAALRVLTRCAVIDGKDMTVEALRPRVKGQTTFVDDLITFAVETANGCLIPQGIEKNHWDNLQPSERFYLKMLDIEAQGHKTLDNYQNFAKAFKVKDFRLFMASERANAARLKSAADFGRADMSGDSEFASSTLRGILYALMELQKDIDGDEVVKHLSYNVPDYFNQRDGIVEISDYLARKLEGIRSEEASTARVLRDLIRHQRV